MTAPEPGMPRPPRARSWRVAALSGASLLLVAGAAITMAASPAPSASPDTNTGTEQGDEPRPFRDGPFGLRDGFAAFAGRHGGFGAGSITITAIDGSSVTLETVDGWTRTIEVTADTEITKDGDDAELGDLEVGDEVRFRQTRADDDTFAITDLVVVQPTVVGTVTATAGDSITLRQPDGSSVTVHVDEATEFTVNGETGQSLADVELGMVLGAAGDRNDDGSLDASTVRAGDPGAFGRGHHRHGPGMDGTPDPTPSPQDESSTSAS